jgi:uncharacterized membrane protein (DUF2068 family)
MSAGPHLELSLNAGAVDQRHSKAGLRAVASFEALKGAVVLVLGIALLAVHSDFEELVENLLYHLHIDFDRRLGHMMLNAATTLADARWWAIGIAVGTYCSVRFIEAWGLWNRRVWAEWFALLSGALYMPWELLKVIERPDWERVGVLLINLMIVLYMLWIRLDEVRRRRLDKLASQAAAVRR